MRKFVVASTIVFFAGQFALAQSAGEITKSANACEKQKTDAEAECRKAQEKAQSSADAALASLENAKNDPNVQNNLTMLINNARAEADKLEEIKANCTKKAQDATKKCIASQEKITSLVQKLGGSVKDGKITLGGAGGGDVTPALEAARNTVAQIAPSQDKVHTSYWRADTIRSQDIPTIQTRIDSLRARADELEAQRNTVTAGGTPADGNGNTTKAVDQGGAAAAKAAQQATAAGAGQGAGAGNPAQAVGAAPVATETVPSTNTANAGTMNVIEPSTTSSEFGQPDAPITGLDDNQTTTTKSSSARNLPELPPLPPSSATEVASPGGAGGGDLNFDKSRGPAAAAAVSGRPIPSVLGGSGGGGGSSYSGGSRSWWSSVGEKLGFSSGRQNFGGQKNANAANVDLSRFLPGQISGRASREAMGIHGPNVNFFSKVNERYHSLQGSFDP